MTTTDILTPESIFEPAGFWRRVGSTVVDALVVGFAAVAINTVFSLFASAGLSVGLAPNDTQAAAGLGAGIVLLSLLVSLGIQVGSYLYYILMWNKKGQTVGCMAAGIKVIDARTDGLIGKWRGLWRMIAEGIVLGVPAAVGAVAGLMGAVGVAQSSGADDFTTLFTAIFGAVIGGLVGYLVGIAIDAGTMLFNPRRRMLHDLMAGTAVIRYERNAAIATKPMVSSI